MSAQTLVLNASYEPLVVIDWQRAIQLLFQGKAETVEESTQSVRSVSITIKIPLVLRLIRYIPFGSRSKSIRFSRENVFLRDEYQCQYCGLRKTKLQLTLDHVIPATQGGPKTWENIATACRECNQKKGGKTPEQAKMKLLKSPREPSVESQFKQHLLSINVSTSWKPYFYK